MAPATVMSREDVDEMTLTEIAETCGISIVDIEDVFACTGLQIACMAESALSPGANWYQYILSLGSNVDTERLCVALRQVVTLNAVLRTRLVDCRHGLVQVVTSNEHDTRYQSQSEDVGQYLQYERERSFHLGMPLFRSAIMHCKLVLTIHHAVLDFWSLTPLLEDLMTCYYNRQPEKRPAFKQFVSYCIGVDEAQAKAFWTSRFSGAPTIFPKVRPEYVPAATCKLNKEIKLERIGTEISLAQIPSYIEASWALTAGVYSGSQSVTYGLVLSGRSHTGAETTIGPTIVTIPVQVNFQHVPTVQSLLKDRAASLRQLQASPALQYGSVRISNVSEAARSAAGFQTMLNIRPSIESKESEDLKYEYSNEPQGAFALILSCNFIHDGILLEASSDPGVICEIQLKRIVQQFEHTLQSMMKVDPQTKVEQLQLINPHDRAEVSNWNSSIPKPGDQCVHEVFMSRVRELPGIQAVEASDGSATYDELDKASNRLAHELRRRGTSTGSPVPFIFEKSLWAVVSILAIMKAGGACVPIEIADPRNRKASIVSSANAKIILTSAQGYDSAADLAADVFIVSKESIEGLDMPTTPIAENTVRPEDLAYIIFTSGSTGTPKGAMLEHRGLVSSLSTIRSRTGWQQGCRVLQFAAHVWDISMGEILGTLLFGGCVCIPSEEARKSNLAGFINSSRTELAWLTPTVLRTISPDDVPGLKMLLSIGEAVSPDAANTWGRALRLFNGWGPCETSILSAIARLTADSPYPETIGAPVGCAMWITNVANVNELAPIGATGELVIEGPGVARGYLNDKAKAAASFIKPPSWAPTRESSSGRMFRTGDLARYNSDGTFSFAGRKDNQIKIRGQRLELGELESVLSSCKEVRAIFAAPKINAGRTELVAVVCLEDLELPRQEILQEVSKSCAESASRQLRAVKNFARSKLPAFMIPTVWLAVEAMPSTTSAKIDRVTVLKWLKQKDLSTAKASLEANLASTLTPPSTKEERLLQSIWSSILDVPEKNIGLESSFIQLGGDSILAMQASSRCRKQGYQASAGMLLLTGETLASIASEISPVTSSDDATSPYPEKRESQTIATILSSRKSRLSQLNETTSLFHSDNIESLVPATDSQAGMLALGAIGNGNGYLVNFTLRFTATVDTEKLRRACEEVIRNHQILRTVFVQHGSSLYQLALKTLTTNMVVEEQDERTKETVNISEESTLVLFHLLVDGQRCHALRLEIHHALYDALSLQLVLRDLDSAYRAEALSGGPQFGAWVTDMDKVDGSAARKFWRETLEGASMSYIVPQHLGAVRGHPLTESNKINVPLKTLQNLYGTPSSVFKTVWGIVLAQALGTHDVVFGEVSANRYVDMPDITEVKGPCVNNVPVRVRFDGIHTVGSLIQRVQEESTASLPHHHLGMGSLIKDCTPWPRWTRFSSALAFQNHGALVSSVPIGDAMGVLSHQGDLADSADMYILATPSATALEVELRFSSQTLSSQQVEWITQALQNTLQAVPSLLEQPLSELQASLEASVGSYAAPEDVLTNPSLGMVGNPHDPSSEAVDIVSKAWAEIGLSPPQSREDCSMFTQGADIVAALLLSQYYRFLGIEKLSVDDIFQNHRFLSQAHLIDSRRSLQNGVNGDFH